MIVKLTKDGGYCLYVEADTVLRQDTQSGCVDLEICRGGQAVKRVLIGEPTFVEAFATYQGHPTKKAGSSVDSSVIPVAADFYLAYIIEHGKTVDTIRTNQIIEPSGGTQ